MLEVRRLTFRQSLAVWAVFLVAYWLDQQYQPKVKVDQAFLVTLLIYAALFVLAELLRPKPKIENARPSGLGDFNFPTATEARVVPLIWGTVMMEGPNVIWYGDLRQEPIKEKIKTGMFSSERITVGFKYYIGIQFGLCRGTIDQLRGIWIAEKRVYTGTSGAGTITINEPELFGGDKLGNGGVAGDLDVYVGTTAQAVSSYLATYQDSGAGTTRTPRYSGTAYCVWKRGYIGNSSSVEPWKFEIRRIPNGLGLVTPSVNSGNDANPMNVLYEILTNSEWGYGFPAADIDTANFTTAANTLTSEGNGFSMVLDSTRESVDMIQEIEKQIEGVVFLDHRTGKWKVKLARDDYNINTIIEVSRDTNLLEVGDYSRGGWSETTNQVRIRYFDRAQEYTERTAFAQDSANCILQGGGTVTTGNNVTADIQMPGVKDATLASNIAWRELRTLSYPLAKAKLTVTRALWDQTPGNVVAWTDSVLGFTRLPMRIVRIDYGQLAEGKIILDCVQDVFKFALGSFAPPNVSGWTPPSDTLVPFTQTKIFEASRGIVIRDPNYDGTISDKIWCGAVAAGPEVGFRIRQRVSPAAYTAAGTCYGLLYVGTLGSSLNRGAAVGASFSVTAASLAEKTNLLVEMAGKTAEDLGNSLSNLILVGNEFMLVGSVVSGAGNAITFSSVYRGVMDSTQQDHASSADVWMLFLSGNVTDTSLVPGTTVDIKLLPFSRFNEVAEGSVTATPITMSNRIRRPYLPSRLTLNGTLDDTTSVSLEGAGSGDNIGIDLSLTRRDYRTTDEVQAMGTDAATIFSDFPTANTTQHQIEVRNDPAGANTLLFTVAYSGNQTFRLERNDILQGTSGVLPTTLGLVITARHTYETVVYTSTYNLTWQFTTATALTGQFNFGALNQNTVSNLYTATVTGTYNVSINTALATGNVEYRLNAGAWTTVISTGNTTGSFSATSGDTVELRHTSGTAATQTFLTFNAPGAGQDGYAVLYRP